jgi:methionine synthase / methylenetetrahydrofolate reductase(NADPH)
MDLRQLVKEEGFLRVIELEPPSTPDLSPLLESIKNFNADAFNVVDSPLGRPLMHPMALCHKIQNLFGTPTIMHFTCRDRNQIEMKADLLAAKALEVSSVLALTGDKLGEASKAKPVFEFSSLGLIKLIREMNEKKGTDFYIGCGANLNADIDAEIKRTQAKIEAGAEFVMTQPCYDLPTIVKFLQSIDKPVFIGLITLYSKEEAEKLNAAIPGIFPLTIFDEELDGTYARLISEMKEAGAKGVNVMPFGNFEAAKKLIQV